MDQLVHNRTEPNTAGVRKPDPLHDKFNILIYLVIGILVVILVGIIIKLVQCIRSQRRQPIPYVKQAPAAHYTNSGRNSSEHVNIVVPEPPGSKVSITNPPEICEKVVEGGSGSFLSSHQTRKPEVATMTVANQCPVPQEETQQPLLPKTDDPLPQGKVQEDKSGELSRLYLLVLERLSLPTHYRHPHYLARAVCIQINTFAFSIIKIRIN